MKSEQLRSFVNKIGAISHNQPGNISSAGFFGSASSQDSMVETLKRNVITFASEFSKPTPDEVSLVELASQVEGGLQGLNAVGSISDKQLDQLVSELHNLKN